MATLKEREQRILSYMKEEIKTKGYPPTVREICGALGIKSTSTAHKDIESLVKQGYLVKDPSKPRALMVVDPVSGKHGESQPSAYDDSARAHSGIVNIPVVGSVAAGTPILAEQNIEDFSLFLPSTLPEGKLYVACTRRKYDRGRHNGRRPYIGTAVRNCGERRYRSSYDRRL